MLKEETAASAATAGVCLSVEKFGEGFVAGPLGNCPVSYLRFKGSRVLIPVKEQERREDMAIASASHDRLIAACVNPDEPFRYLPPAQPVIRARVPNVTSRLRSLHRRRPIARWADI